MTRKLEQKEVLDTVEDSWTDITGMSLGNWRQGDFYPTAVLPKVQCQTPRAARTVIGVPCRDRPTLSKAPMGMLIF